MILARPRGGLLLLVAAVVLGCLLLQGQFAEISHSALPHAIPQPARTLLMKEKPLPWWDGGDCGCVGAGLCLPKEAPRLSWEDAGGACGLRAWAAGEGRRVISFSLYGNDARFWKAFRKNFDLIKTQFPGWVVWVYTDPRGRENIMCPLLRDFPFLYVCDVTNLPSLGDVTSIHNMIWRALPLGDARLSAFFVRDSDALLLEREAEAVKEWMSENKTFHVLRDHPRHIGPIMGGLWGVRWDHVGARARHSLVAVRDAIIRTARGKFRKGDDQPILWKTLYPRMKGDLVAHDSFSCERFPEGSRPFPTQRVNGTYIGNYAGGQDVDHLLVTTPCPVKCRPKNHQDWTYC
ncbi:uncharacterized protein LOC125032611 [Penaeus chinensis]|uniref:uncharacterized protein LOC125032611 n=1 Tax=Penaeus chinensis TaxID=139456 RepID=UPI001FB69FE1|nr:uncharacterized protein LOC125032611 [Penaeus chinensis]